MKTFDWISIERSSSLCNGWKGKSDKLDYKMKLVTEYNTLKHKGMTDKKIARLFPEMRGVIHAINKEDDDGSSSNEDQED